MPCMACGLGPAAPVVAGASVEDGYTTVDETGGGAGIFDVLLAPFELVGQVVTNAQDTLGEVLMHGQDTFGDVAEEGADSISEVINNGIDSTETVFEGGQKTIGEALNPFNLFGFGAGVTLAGVAGVTVLGVAGAAAVDELVFAGAGRRAVFGGRRRGR